MTHDEVADLLGAYALDAVSRDEGEAVEAHLETCRECSEELGQLLSVHDHLAMLAVEREPPPELRGRLLALVEEDLAREAGIRAPIRPVAVADPTGTAGSRPLGRRSRRVPPMLYGVGGALAVAAVILIVVLVGRKGLTTNTYTGGPVAHVVHGIDLRGATAQVGVRSDQTTEVRFTGLPVLPPSLAYELWFIPAAGKPIPVDGFVVRSRQVWDRPYPRDASGIQTVALTIERAPGRWPTPGKYLAVAVSLKG